MTIFDFSGYLACALVFMAFYMKDMVLLRLVGLGSNIAFIVYAFGYELAPVAVLHLALIPINCWRLWQMLREREWIGQAPRAVIH
jgi:hypothetical protein